MSGNFNRPRCIIRAEAVWRIFFLKFIADADASIRIVEFPKSGGSWCGDMLSDVLGVDFPRNRFPLRRKTIFHGHSLRMNKVKKNIVVWRDPRDVMVSWYHHCIIGNGHVNPSFVQQCRNSFGVKSFQNVSDNMAHFIRWSFDSPPSPGFNWSEFFDYWENKDAVWVRYEDLISDPFETLNDVLRRVSDEEFSADQIKRVIELHSFKHKSGRDGGEEDKASFLRKGVVGDWVNYFTDESLEELRSRVGTRTIRLGYQ